MCSNVSRRAKIIDPLGRSAALKSCIVRYFNICTAIAHPISVRRRSSISDAAFASSILNLVQMRRGSECLLVVIPRMGRRRSRFAADEGQDGQQL